MLEEYVVKKIRMKELLNILLNRKEGIKDWLKKNNLELFLEKADQILNDLPREKIKEEFKNGITKALKFCLENNEIKALDFEWYYSKGKVSKAFAYGLDDCSGDNNLSKSDLGPKELPGIELKLEHGNLIDEDFSEIPVNIAINEMVEHLLPTLEQSKELGNLLGDAENVITDYFQIWNYKLGYEVCKELVNSDVVKKLKNRSPFWVTMTRHWRCPVGIMLIS